MVVGLFRHVFYEFVCNWDRIQLERGMWVPLSSGALCTHGVGPQIWAERPILGGSTAQWPPEFIAAPGACSFAFLQAVDRWKLLHTRCRAFRRIKATLWHRFSCVCVC